MYFKYRSIFLSLFVVFHTTISAEPHSNSKVQFHNDNLSIHRTKFAYTHISLPQYFFIKPKSKKKYIFPIEHDITHKVHELLLDLKSYYEMTEYILGYTIQVYTGTNRQLAFQIKDKLCNLYPNLDVELQYKQPNFTVSVGKFLEHIEAFEPYVGIKKLLHQAIIRLIQFPNKADIFMKKDIADSCQDLEDGEDEIFEEVGETESNL